MCGACGGGGRSGPLWEDGAGRVDAAGRRARVRAVGRLTASSQWRVRDWHGSWSTVSPTGSSGHAATLDELFTMLPAVILPLVAAEQETVSAAPPPGWHVQAALVWVAAARAAGVSAQLVLPIDTDRALRVDLADAQPVTTVPGDGRVHVTGSSATELLTSLLRTAGENDVPDSSPERVKHH